MVDERVRQAITALQRAVEDLETSVGRLEELVEEHERRVRALEEGAG